MLRQKVHVFDSVVRWNSLRSIFQCCFISFFIMIVFSWLTYRNIQRTIALANQNVDYQLVKMTLFQVSLAIIGFLPFGSYNVHLLITQYVPKSYNRLLIERFILTILSIFVEIILQCYSLILFINKKISFTRFSSIQSTIPLYLHSEVLFVILLDDLQPYRHQVQVDQCLSC